MLDIDALHKVRASGNRVVSQCPACHVIGKDRSSNHLVYYVDSEAFSCIAHPNDSAHLSEVFSLVGIKKELTSEDKAKQLDMLHRRAQERRAREFAALQAQRVTEAVESTLGAKLKPYLSDTWRTDLLDSSPVYFDTPDRIAHEFIQSLFQPSDILWLGGEFDSGKEKHRANFKSCEQWLELEELPPRIAAGTFKAESFSRSQANVESSPFILVECDEMLGHLPETPEEKELNKAKSFALIKFLEEELDLSIRAIIDTGNKSIHCWMDKPAPAELSALLSLARGLRIDESPINSPHFPLRMPHSVHDKTKQQARLLYLKPIHKLTP